MNLDIHDPEGTGSALRFALGVRGNAPLYVIGVNPSTACRERSDPTIEKVGKLSQRWGYDGFVMLNLYPLRKTRPSELPTVYEEELITSNSKFICNMLCAKSQISIWAAWGNAVDSRDYFTKCLREIDKATAAAKIKWLVCGELTKKGGNPRHPNPHEPLLRTQERGLADFDFRRYLQRKLPD